MMRTAMLLGMSALLSITAASANAGEALASNPAIVAASAPVPGDQAVEAIAAQDLIGRDITNTQDATIGEIESVYVDAKGNVRQVIVSVGGFLAIGERSVALDWKDLVVSDGGKKIAASATKDQLMNMPPYSYAKPSQQGTVFADVQ